ncbi:MAG: hypothetical protein QHH24_01275 [Candidatus Bathyarchaeota archaeon]|nr:hypothetical protein [Candidatus Bathyarchaeota archaeon]
MSLQYESAEFSEELKKRINRSSEFREKIGHANLKTLIIVKDVPSATFASFVEGVLEERNHIPLSQIEEYRKKADFTIEIPTYELSVDVASGKKSLESLYLGGMLKMEGSVFKALQYRDVFAIVAKITADLVNQSTVPLKEDFVKMLQKRGLL